MSRAYDMDLTVRKLKKKEDGETAKEIIDGIWSTSYGYTDPDAEDGNRTWALCTGGEGHLCGGETEEEFTSRITQAIWSKLGYYTEVTVTAVYLEELPSETHSLDQHDYETYLKEKKGEEDGEDTDG